MLNGGICKCKTHGVDRHFIILTGLLISANYQCCHRNECIPREKTSWTWCSVQKFTFASYNLGEGEGIAKLSKISFFLLPNLLIVGLKSLGTPVCSKVFSPFNIAAIPFEARPMRGIPCPENPAIICCPGLFGISPTYGMKSELYPITEESTLN